VGAVFDVLAQAVVTAVLVTVLGCLMIVAGVGLWSIPAALVVSGVMLALAGLLFDFEE